MKIGVLGTGNVGRTIAAKLVELDHDVLVGSRTAKEDAVTFADAADHGELVFNCTAGDKSLEALRMAEADNLAGKILVDVANPLDFSRGMPPILAVCNADSLGEEIQRLFPRVEGREGAEHRELQGDGRPVDCCRASTTCSSAATTTAPRTRCGSCIQSFGWPAERIIDLGDITASARHGDVPAALAPPRWTSAESATFNIKVVR